MAGARDNLALTLLCYLGRGEGNFIHENVAPVMHLANKR